MNQKFDLIFSLGSACSCTQMLRQANLQRASYPLDWVAGGNFLTRAELFLTRFETFFRKEDLIQTHELSSTNKEIFLNQRTGISFPHDFQQGKSLEDLYPLVLEKYSRRIQRLFQQIDNANSILIVCMEKPNFEEKNPCSPEEILQIFSKIEGAFPEKEIHLCYITYNASLPHKTIQKEKIAENIVHFISEYRSIEPHAKPHSVDHDFCQNFMRGYRLKTSWRERLGTALKKIGLRFIPFGRWRKAYKKRFHIYK